METWGYIFLEKERPLFAIIDFIIDLLCKLVSAIITFFINIGLYLIVAGFILYTIFITIF